MATFANGEGGLSVRTKINAVLQHADGTAGELVINDAGADVDFRVESDTFTHAVYMDAATGNVGIGTAAPSLKFVVSNSGAAGLEIGTTLRDGATLGTSMLSFTRSGGARIPLEIDASDLRFDTGGYERMRITAAGIALIGTTSASGANLLQVNSDARINGLTVGLGAGAVSTNAALGGSALAANTTGGNNVAVGFVALQANTSGGTNSAVGVGALQANTTGGANSAVGYAALNANTTGGNNVAFGSNALQGNLGASNNTAVGLAALQTNTSGASNTAVGYAALNVNTTGGSNIGIGQNAGNALTTGSNNTIIGSIAGTAGLANTVIIGAGTTERLRIDSNGNLGVGTTTPNAASIIDAQSTTKGVRFPNMTTTQKALIANVAGNVVFDTTLGKLCVNTGSGWQTITST